MSGRILGPLVASVVGVIGGIYIFKPLLDADHRQRMGEAPNGRSDTGSSSGQNEKKGSNTTVTSGGITTPTTTITAEGIKTPTTSITAEGIKTPTTSITADGIKTPTTTITADGIKKR